MRNVKHFLIGLMSVAVLVGAVAFVQPPSSQALDFKGGFQFKKVLKKIFPSCGPGTRGQRFVVSKDGTSVCDNKTGLWWQQSPSPSEFTWQEAIAHCANLELPGNHHQKKEWRLAEVKELISLVDYSFHNKVVPLNDPNGPFMNVQPSLYWSATEEGGDPASAWTVSFLEVFVFPGTKFIQWPAWCVSGDKNAHAL